MESLVGLGFAFEGFFIINHRYISVLSKIALFIFWYGVVLRLLGLIYRLWAVEGPTRFFYPFSFRDIPGTVCTRPTMG